MQAERHRVNHIIFVTEKGDSWSRSYAYRAKRLSKPKASKAKRPKVIRLKRKSGLKEATRLTNCYPYENK